MAFAKFMASPAGRWLRVIVGVVLVIVGVILAFQPANTLPGVIIAVVGLLPLVAGVVDVCLFAPLFGAPLSGPRIRASAH